MAVALGLDGYLEFGENAVYRSFRQMEGNGVGISDAIFPITLSPVHLVIIWL